MGDVDFIGPISFQKVIYGLYSLSISEQMLYVDGTDHVFLEESSYGDQRSICFCVSGLILCVSASIVYCTLGV